VRPGDVSAIVWALLDYASQHDDRGSIEGHDSETLADFFGYEVSQVDAVKDALRDKEVTDGTRFIAWDKRQPAREDATAADRKRTQRERERRERDEAGQRDASRNVTQQYGTDSDTDTDTERKKEGRVAGATDETPMGFVGKVVRLTRSDYDDWRKTYCNVPDFDAELRTADNYYSETPPKGGKWFFAVSNWLKKAHEQNKPKPKFGL
jgi:hypothetical protein